MTNVLFYGPLGNKKGTIIGGGESGNKRTIQLLAVLGFNVIILRKPNPIKVRGLKPIIYLVQLFFAYLKFIWKLITAKVDSFHLSAFYFHLVYIECLFILTCRLFNVASIYEIRAGGAEMAYKTRSSFYRYVFRLVLKKATFVLCQGRETIVFVESVSHIKALYYPNFIIDKYFAPYNLNKRDKSKKIELVYFGRIVAVKGVEFVIEVCKILNEAHFPFTMEIVGRGENEFVTHILQKISEYGLKEQVKISPPADEDTLFSLLLKKHYFVFPTTESREGHSNSLTEAMSRGVVPVVSAKGFNRSVVSNDDLVIEEFSPQLYADKIIGFWESGQWADLSERCYNTIKNHFTEDAVKEVMVKAHNKS